MVTAPNFTTKWSPTHT